MNLLRWLDNAKQSPAFRPAYFSVKPENTDVSSTGRDPFQSNQQYFDVVINELYLSYKRKWLNTFDPMVFALTEFEYAGKTSMIPYVVGRSQFSQKNQQLPEGFMFKNTRVAGIHPAKGNSIAITVILSRIPVENPLRKVISVLEKITGTYSKEFGSMAGNYFKIANVLLDGIEMLTDSDEVKPIVGVRDQYSQEYFRPGYFVLINEEAEKFDHDMFFVRNNELLYGNDIRSAKPFRSDDYVLYGLNNIFALNDIETLPMFDRWRNINESISKIFRKLSDDEKRLYRGQLLELGTDMTFSPDLTKPQVAELKKEYKAKLEDLIAERDLLSGSDAGVLPVKDDWKNAIELLNKELLQ